VTSPPLAQHDLPQSALKLVEPRWTTRSGLLEIRSSNEAGHWTLSLTGELDVSNVATLDDEIRLAETSA
jgi:hypothetical protein